MKRPNTPRRARPITPPTTPPAIAPTFVDDFIAPPPPEVVGVDVGLLVRLCELIVVAEVYDVLEPPLGELSGLSMARDVSEDKSMILLTRRSDQDKEKENPPPISLEAFTSKLPP